MKLFGRFLLISNVKNKPFSAVEDEEGTTVREHLERICEMKDRDGHGPSS